MSLRNGLLIVWAFLVGAVSVCGAAEYKGADAGYLVYSMGSLKIPINSTFYYRRIGSRSKDRGVMEYNAVGFFTDKPDYEGHETGKVTVRRLEPGNYEVYQLGFAGTLIGTATTYTWSSKTEFSMPFNIKPGGATYIGNFVRAPSLGTSLEPALGAKGFFVISDKHDRDLPIAQKSHPELPAVEVSVTDVSSWGYPVLLTKEP